MKLIIEISERTYKRLKNRKETTADLNTICKAVLIGKPFPKGHGRLIDAEKLAREINRAWTLWEKKGEDCYLFSDVLTPMLVSQQTIIEANKEVENDSKD